MSELFNMEPSLSPFETWKLENHIKTHFWKEAVWPDEAPWLASAPGKDFPEIGPDDCGEGESELEACFDVAKKYKLVWFQNGKVPQ